MCCYWEESAKLKLEPGVSGWRWQLWSDSGWRWRVQRTAALLSSAQFFLVLISSCAAAPGWCLSASSAVHHAFVLAAGMFRSTSGSCTRDPGVTSPPSSTAAAARAPPSGLSALFLPVCHVHFSPVGMAAAESALWGQVKSFCSANLK